MLSTMPNQTLPTKAYEPWVKEEEANLMELYEAGKKLSEIATIHQRSTGAIIARISKLTHKSRDDIEIIFRDRE